MKAAIYTGIQEIRLKDVDITKPPPGYVMVDTKCTGICGSDLHFYFGNWHQSTTFASGHEICGLVAEVGEGVTGFKLGDKITCEYFLHCGHCVYCKTGQYNHCVERKSISYNTHGGFAEYTTAHASGVVKLPESMSFEEGTFVEPLAVAYRAHMQAKTSIRDRIAIIGGGTMGQLCLAVAKLIGVRETLIIVKYDQQAQLAMDIGADHVVRIGGPELKEYVCDLSQGIGMDVVIETVGSGQAFNDALSIIRKRGRMILMAGYYKPLEINLRPIVASEVVLKGSNCYAYSGLETDFEASIRLINTQRFDVTKLITHRFPLVDIADAFKTAADKRSGSIKVLVCQ